MLYAVIMAGGAGTRFWPASRQDTPKQLLDLASSQTMIQDTAGRLGELAPADRTLVITNQRLVEPIAQQLPELPAENIVGEPCKRDTAPCVGLAAALIAAKDPEAMMLVMPADHVIRPESKFRETVSYAIGLVEADPQRIITFGIRPSYPAATYGYIERAESLGAKGSPLTFRVDRFREKPSVEIAQEYLDTGNFYWNAGIFIWKAKTILAALEKFEPEMAKHLAKIGAAVGTDQYDKTLEQEFTAIKGKSIDYAVMERYDDVVVVEAPFDWDDVGNWSSISRLNKPDENGNIILGKHAGVRSTNNIIRAEDGHLIATLGMKDCIIVHTPKATLVANRRDEESIRELVDAIKAGGLEEYL